LVMGQRLYESASSITYRPDRYDVQKLLLWTSNGLVFKSYWMIPWKFIQYNIF
jgi:hypothetical protein